MLVEARVPKSAVIGVVILETETDPQHEVVVDFEKVPASAFRQLGKVECSKERQALRDYWRTEATKSEVLAVAD